MPHKKNPRAKAEADDALRIPSPKTNEKGEMISSWSQQSDD
jgi:hypothetical protein